MHINRFQNTPSRANNYIGDIRDIYVQNETSEEKYVTGLHEPMYVLSPDQSNNKLEILRPVTAAR